MDILYIVENANLRGGTELLTFSLMNALRLEEQDCKILSIVPYKGKDANVFSLTEDEYQAWSISAKSFKNKLCFNKESDYILGGFLRKKITDLKPRVVVNQTYDLITALPVDLNVCQVFNWSVRGYENSVKKSIFRKGFIGRILSLYVHRGICKRRHEVISNVSKLVTLSNAAADELKSLNPKVKDAQIVMIPDPLVVSKDSMIISSLQNKKIIFVGRLSYEKGALRILRIWERISKRLSNYSLHIYGEGDVEYEMHKYICSRHLERVEFKGFCSDHSRIYPNADLLCMTSDTEGFGMVLIEAMYHGVPCISFDCPISPKEIIADAGVTVSCFDEEAYANAVIELLDDKDRLKELQRKSIERAKDFYMNKIVEKWKQL